MPPNYGCKSKPAIPMTRSSSTDSVSHNANMTKDSTEINDFVEKAA